MASYVSVCVVVVWSISITDKIKKLKNSSNTSRRTTTHLYFGDFVSNERWRWWWNISKTKNGDSGGGGGGEIYVFLANWWWEWWTKIKEMKGNLGTFELMNPTKKM